MQVRGAHVRGHNDYTIGVCLMGGMGLDGTPENNYTQEQMASLFRLCKFLLGEYPMATIQGHREFPGVKKPCPCFDVSQWALFSGLIKWHEDP